MTWLNIISALGFLLFFIFIISLVILIIRKWKQKHQNNATKLITKKHHKINLIIISSFIGFIIDFLLVAFLMR